MERKEKIERFRNLSLGLFIHYGLYSVMGKGEWIKFCGNVPDDEYDALCDRFAPRPDWAKKICSFAKKNGFKYAVLTTRHHDGFSLYDTLGLNNYDAKHVLGRDLVSEFVSACREEGIVPFFYHTLIDWREEKNFDSFASYLVYLRNSVEILCKNYGEIGGFWFDGQWKYLDANWEWDALVNLVKSYQPDAMVINNSGLDNLGGVIDNLFDSLTFERSNVSAYDYFALKDSLAVEMCQTLNSYWGYAKNDFSYKSVEELIENLCICRKNGGNFLLNIGPMPDGSIRPIDKQIIDMLGTWIRCNKKALYTPRPCKIELTDNRFALKNKDKYYVFVGDTRAENVSSEIILPFESIKSVSLIDDGQPVEIEKVDNGYKVTSKLFTYGSFGVTRILEVITK